LRQRVCLTGCEYSLKHLQREQMFFLESSLLSPRFRESTRSLVAHVVLLVLHWIGSWNVVSAVRPSVETECASSVPGHRHES
jgi:hypothetical protein